MSEFRVNPDDVVSMNQPAESLLGSNSPTFKIDQLQKILRERIGNNSVTQSWMGDGADC